MVLRSNTEKLTELPMGQPRVVHRHTNIQLRFRQGVINHRGSSLLLFLLGTHIFIRCQINRNFKVISFSL